MSDVVKPLVFIAEDEDFFRTALAGGLRFFGYEVQEVCNGEEFWNEIEKLLMLEQSAIGTLRKG